MAFDYRESCPMRTSLMASMQANSTSPSNPVFSNVYTPDDLGRITEIDQAGSGLAPLSVDMQYVLDGQLQGVQRYQASSAMATSSYLYYGDGRLKSLTDLQGSGTIRQDSYAYDLAGRTAYECSLSPVNIPSPGQYAADPANITNGYTYDAAGELTQVSDKLRDTVANYAYDPDGNPQPAAGTVLGANNQIAQDANGVYQYDAQGNLTTQWVQKAVLIPGNGSQLPQSGNGYFASQMSMTSTGEYELQLKNVLLQWTGPVPSDLYLNVSAVNGSSFYAHTFTVPLTSNGGYLSLSGSTSFFFSLPAGFPGSANTDFSASFSLATGSPSTITLNNGSAWLNQITAIDVKKYDYLNRLVEVDQYVPSPDGAATFTRPTDNVAVAGNLSQTTTYTYDVLGNRIAESNQPAGGTATTTWYVNDSGKIALELTQQSGQAAALSQVRLNGAAVDQVLAVHSLAQGAADQVYWLLANRQNTVLDEQTLMSNGAPSPSGQPGDLRVGFTGFGAPLSSNPAVPVVIYAGQECDLVTSLNFDQARFYDPALQRFVNCDPLGLDGGTTNEYCYCDNSWPNGTDPSGCVINVVGGAAIGGLLGAGAYCYQYWTGGVQNFSWTDLGAYTLGGIAAGAVAGATFGASLAVMGAGVGALGLTGTTAAVATSSLTLGITGGAAAAAGGFVTNAGMTYAHGGNVGQSLAAGYAGAQQGAFYGTVSGLVAGAALPLAAVGGSGMLGGGLAMGGSFALGDWAAQRAAMAVGLQNSYNPYQTIFAGGVGFGLGAYSGYQNPDLGVFTSGFRSLLPAVPNGTVRWIDDTPSMGEAARDYEDGAMGARSNLATQRRQVPVLDRTLPDGTTAQVKVDGFDESTNVLIDRKIAVTTFPKSQNQALRQSAALRENGYTGRWEVPNEAQAVRARGMLEGLGVTNIDVEVVTR